MRSKVPLIGFEPIRQKVGAFWKLCGYQFHHSGVFDEKKVFSVVVVKNGTHFSQPFASFETTCGASKKSSPIRCLQALFFLPLNPWFWKSQRRGVLKTFQIWEKKTFSHLSRTEKLHLFSISSPFLSILFSFEKVKCVFGSMSVLNGAFAKTVQT